MCFNYDLINYILSRNFVVLIKNKRHSPIRSKAFVI